MNKVQDKVNIYDESTWIHLVIPYEELTKDQQDEVFCHHVETGGDMIFLSNGMVLYI